MPAKRQACAISAASLCALIAFAGNVSGTRCTTSTWLGWMAGGGILLAWVARKFLFDTSSWQQPRMDRLHARAQSSGDEEMGFEWRQPEEDSEERRYAKGVWSIYDSDELDFGR